ncbi:hypothetical protein L914_01542 [Phytophthora nicotianae]|uniref:Cas12f1-like TNB domain-containing protein n=1 Tax=Phytophthora nicotianae TaxID=4792 RepID=W2P5I9_PHYNI|nr:hypothetical protein L914_01542 [Phytophthora nicotianae]
MRNNHKKTDEYPDEWDVVEDSQDPDELSLPFEIVAETQDSDEGDTSELSQDLLQLTVTNTKVVHKQTKKSSLKRQQPKKVTAKSKKIQVKKPKRVKSEGTMLEKAFRKGKGFCSVVCRLTSICPDSLLVEEIKRTARAMKQIQMETWHLANIHTLRCLENNLPSPDFGNTFFDHCCSGIYRADRERAGLEETMVTNAGVMIREHFRKRLRAYVEITFGGGQSKKARQERRKKIVQACYNVEETDLLEALQMRDILTPNDEEWSDKWIPWSNHIKGNGMGFYVRLIWEFQSVTSGLFQGSKTPRHRNERDIVSVTTREYRHMVGFNRFRAWNEGQKRSHPEYWKIIAEMPSFKTASSKKYLERLEYFWRHARFLLQFCVDRPFLKWKFFQKRMSQHKGIKGHALSPVKGLKQALQKRAKVVSIDEFRTSKLCSQCHQTLSQVDYIVDVKLPKKRKRKGVVLPRNRAEVQLEEKTCYRVLRCDHVNCIAHYWDRDVNAAINMVELLKSEILGRGRMQAFKRA